MIHQKTKKTIGLIHIGKRERSGLQIVEKLKQNNFSVIQWDVINVEDKIDGINKVDAIIINIGIASFEYDDLLAAIFETDIKVIINEAGLTNKLSGVNRQSWERHLLNKVDSAFSILPNKVENIKRKQADFSLFGIDQVWILAASIGGPEAIQQFLSEFGADNNFIFIVIQHIDKEFLPNMADQLNRNSQIKVEIPLSGMKINSSICLIHPTDEFIEFNKNGELELVAMNKSYAFTPCIDVASEKLICNISNLNIAVFSGMSSDGIKAAQLIKEKGGKVITQLESTCVLSSIVSGVKEKILIDFEGTPKNMAHYIINNLETNNGK